VSTVERMRGEGVVVDCQEGGKGEEGRGGGGDMGLYLGLMGMKDGMVLLSWLSVGRGILEWLGKSWHVGNFGVA